MPKPKSFRTNTALPPVARAANLAILVMRAVRPAVTSWGQVTAGSMAGVELNDYQVALIEEHMAVVALLRVPAKTTSGITVVACDKCSRYAFVSSSSPVSKKCTLSMSCNGVLYKAGSTQARAKPEPEKATPDDSRTIYGTSIIDDDAPMVF